MHEILKDGSLDPEDLEDFKEYFSLMSCELARCRDIISGLLSFSRQSEIEYKDVDLNEMLIHLVIEFPRRFVTPSAPDVLYATPAVVFIRAHFIQGALHPPATKTGLKAHHIVSRNDEFGKFGRSGQFTINHVAKDIVMLINHPPAKGT
jgi:hypothetical protein